MPRYVQKPLDLPVSRQEQKAADRDNWVKKHLAESRAADEEKRSRLRALRITNKVNKLD